MRQQGCCTVVVALAMVCVWLTIPEGVVTARTITSSNYVPPDISSSSSSFVRARPTFRNNTINDPFMKLEAMREFRAQIQREHERKDRRKSAKEVYSKLPKAPQGNIERVTPEEWEIIDTQQKKRGLSWFGDGSSGNAYSNSLLADPGAYYDKWAQAYRMLGGFIDCDHAKSDNSHDNGNNNNGNNNNGNNGACSRWMMWAAVRFDIFLFSASLCSQNTWKLAHSQFLSEFFIQ